MDSKEEETRKQELKSRGHGRDLRLDRGFRCVKNEPEKVGRDV